jgi:hypothetical protein
MPFVIARRSKSSTNAPLVFTTTPREYEEEMDAQDAAQRLAIAHTTDDFYVMKAVRVIRATVRLEDQVL